MFIYSFCTLYKPVLRLLLTFLGCLSFFLFKIIQNQGTSFKIKVQHDTHWLILCAALCNVNVVNYMSVGAVLPPCACSLPVFASSPLIAKLKCFGAKPM